MSHGLATQAKGEREGDVALLGSYYFQFIESDVKPRRFSIGSCSH